MSRSLNSLILGLGQSGALLGALLALAACDRQAGQPAQGASSDPASTAAAPGGAAGEPAKGIDRSHRGSALPGLAFADPAGRKLALGALTGKPVLVNLWATWCAPCVKELPTLDALAGAGKVRVVTVAQDSGDPAKVAAFLKDKGLTHLEPWLDPDNNLAFQFGGGTLPMSVLYDAAGHEVWRFTGDQDWTGAPAAALLGEAH